MSVQSIQYLRRGEIDTARWDRCIDTASNGLIYAYSFYLDHMCRHWDALVWNDYEAVMPLTWNKKYGIAYLYQPAFTAQLGVFGKSVSAEMVQQMINAIPKKFKLIEIELNHGNPIDFPLRTNYVLDISNPDYNENLQRNLKKATKQQLIYRAGISVDEVIKMATLNNPANYKTLDYLRFQKLFLLLNARGQSLASGVYTTNNELAASAVFFLSHNRAYYILVGNQKEKRVEGASHFLIDNFIRDNTSKKLLLDFEGSDIKSLANFYGSFGAVVEKYPSLRINRLPWYAKLFTKG